MSKRKRRKRILLLAAAAAFAVFLILSYIRLRPMLEEMTVYTVTDLVTGVVNNVIAEKITDGSLEYNKLVTLEKNESGAVTALITNMANVNELQSAVVNKILEELAECSTTVIHVPLGNILGGTLLSGRGPDIPIKILSVTNVNANFTNEFTSAGINQTRHQIMLDISVNIQALVPGQTCRGTVPVSMVVAETVIVGAVPDTYADLS